jgi:hypothetical protein
MVFGFSPTIRRAAQDTGTGAEAVPQVVPRDVLSLYHSKSAIQG